MFMKIERDQRRFRQIVRGQIRKNLRKYITHGEMIGRKGRDLVSIPIPQLDVPHFRYGNNGSGGVGQGDGEVGQPLGNGGEPQGDGNGQAGSDPGDGHILEVDITLEELAEILGDELELPRIEPKGNAIDRPGKSQVQQHPPDRPRIAPPLQADVPQGAASGRSRRAPTTRTIRASCRSRTTSAIAPGRRSTSPQANAAVIYMMDVSGSMTDEQKEIVRTEAFWIDTWLTSQYDGIETRYIIHDAVAQEVDEHTFYHTRESGGTRISSAYKAVRRLDRPTSFRPSEWNIYCFQFSDGDNWGEDNEEAFKLLGERLLPHVNLFCYGQVESPYGSGEFIRPLAGPLRRQAPTSSCSRKSKTKTRFTIRSRRFWAKANV